MPKPSSSYDHDRVHSPDPMSTTVLYSANHKEAFASFGSSGHRPSCYPMTRENDDIEDWSNDLEIASISMEAGSHGSVIQAQEFDSAVGAAK